MKISFDSGWSSYGGRFGTSVGGTIFDQTIILSEYNFLLVGFPSHDEAPRGSIYWLAISAVRDRG